MKDIIIKLNCPNLYVEKDKLCCRLWNSDYKMTPLEKIFNPLLKRFAAQELIEKNLNEQIRLYLKEE